MHAYTSLVLKFCEQVLGVNFLLLFCESTSTVLLDVTFCIFVFVMWVLQQSFFKNSTVLLIAIVYSTVGSVCQVIPLNVCAENLHVLKTGYYDIAEMYDMPITSVLHAIFVVLCLALRCLYTMSSLSMFKWLFYLNKRKMMRACSPPQSVKEILAKSFWV